MKKEGSRHTWVDSKKRSWVGMCCPQCRDKRRSEGVLFKNTKGPKRYCRVCKVRLQKSKYFYCEIHAPKADYYDIDSEYTTYV